MKTLIANPLRFSLIAAIVLATLVPAACVTVNVNFPEATVQKATDDYVRDLYKAREKGRSSPAADAEVQSPSAKPSAKPGAEPAASMIDRLLIAEAWADSRAVFKVDSPKIDEIKAKQSQNLDKLDGHKRDGRIGEGNDGKLVLDPGKKMPELLKKKFKADVDAENDLRDQLYKEINNLNKSPIQDIQKGFSRSFQGMSPSKTWIQDEAGVWTQKP